MPAFSDPRFLVILVGIPLVAWFAARNFRGTPIWGRVAIGGLRGVILALIAFALAGLGWRSGERWPGVMVLADRSSTMGTVGAERVDEVVGALRNAIGDSRLAIMDFGDRARLAKPFGGRESKLTGGGFGPFSDLGSALNFAGANRALDRPTRVVVVSDGVVTDADSAVAAAIQLQASGVPVDVVGVEVARDPEVEVAGLLVPPKLQAGEAFDATVEIRATQATAVTLRAYQDEVLVAEEEMEVAAGSSQRILKGLLAPSGVGDLRVELVASEDTFGFNNDQVLTVIANGGARALVLDPDPVQMRWTTAQLERLGFRVEVRRVDAAPGSVDELAAFDLVILSDASAAALGASAMRALDEWVSALGGGLLIGGGENAFASGGYAGTPLEDLAPVRIDYNDSGDLPVVAILVSLDRSGSMAAMVGGQSKMALANEGAARTLELLASKDFFGVHAVDTRIHPVLPVGQISDKGAGMQRIRALRSSGGGIYIYTALAAAYRELRDVPARIKHVILFSDAADAEEKSDGDVTGDGQGGTSSLELASAMLAQGITISVVALGLESDRDTAFLRVLASRGGGRFYLTADATMLPRIFAEETLRAAQASVVEEIFQAQVAGDGDPIVGIGWRDAPFLFGYNATSSKPMAEILLTTEGGDPLMARWRYGLGKVAAFTSDLKGRWSADWMDWPGASQWFEQTVRDLVRREAPGALVVKVMDEGAEHLIEIDALDAEGVPRNDLKLVVTQSADAEPDSKVAEQIAPGRYRAIFEAPEFGDRALYAVSDGSDVEPEVTAWRRQSGGGVLGNREMGLKMVAAAGGGNWNPRIPDDVIGVAETPVFSTFNAAPWLLVLAILLIPIDVWLRRRDWG